MEADDLIKKLYVDTYKQDVSINCPIDSNDFKHYLRLDIRFHQVYLAYKSNNNIDLKIDDFINNDLDKINFYGFVKNVLLDMPNEFKPQQIYIDESYPFKFEILKTSFSTLSFEDFKIDINTKFYRTIEKVFYDLTTEEINTRRVQFLEQKINKLHEKIKSRKQKAIKHKRILKYDINGLLVKTYSNRQDCCNAEHFKKAALSLHLSGKRKQLKGYTYKEVKW